MALQPPREMVALLETPLAVDFAQPQALSSPEHLPEPSLEQRRPARQPPHHSSGSWRPVRGQRPPGPEERQASEQVPH